MELRKAARIATELSRQDVDAAAEELHLALVSIPSAWRMLPLLGGATSGGNLASILMVSADGLLADAELATEALCVWLAVMGEGHVGPAAPAVARGVTLLGEMRNLLAAAPTDIDWTALGVLLAMAAADFAPLKCDISCCTVSTWMAFGLVWPPLLGMPPAMRTSPPSIAYW